MKLLWHVFIHIHAWILSYLYHRNSNRPPPVNVTFLFDSVTSFLPTLMLKLFHFLQVVKFSQFDIINFPPCHLPQVNRCQNIILCLIMKRQVYKQKTSLILFHLFGTMIKFLGLIKTGNDHCVIQVSKESMLLRLLITYYGRSVWILKFVMLPRTKIIWKYTNIFRIKNRLGMVLFMNIHKISKHTFQVYRISHLLPLNPP